MKILLIRLDKIGDLVSTLPVDQLPQLTPHDVHWAIARGLSFIPRYAQPPRQVFELDKANTDGIALRSLREFLRKETPDLAVSFQAPWWVNYALWSEGVPQRVGVRSQWHSFLFLNRGLRQRRSRAERHEADYNRELLEFALKLAPSSSPVLQMKAAADVVLPALPSVYVVMHPGMAGSALNWPQKSYVELIRKLTLAGHPVVITGTPADGPYLDEIERSARNLPGVHWLVGNLDSTALLTVLERAQAVLAPSTGVAHLAASLGRPVLCLFSDVRVQRSVRWAPRGPNVQILEPLQNISVGQVEESLRRFL